jgi:hypothetical protein
MGMSGESRIVRGRNTGPTRPRIRAHLSLIASKPRPNARIRRAVRRSFIVAGNRPIFASEVIARAFPRVKKPTDWQRWSVRRALLQEATVIHRIPNARGRPCLWALREAKTQGEKTPKD